MRVLTDHEELARFATNPREHYVAKQVQPVADRVLETLGLDFERVIGDRRQRDLF